MENIKENKKEVLKIEDLSISFYTPVGEVKAVDSIIPYMKMKLWE